MQESRTDLRIGSRELGCAATRNDPDVRRASLGLLAQHAIRAREPGPVVVDPDEPIVCHA